MDLGFKDKLIVIGGGMGPVGQELQNVLRAEGAIVEVLDLIQGIDISNQQVVVVREEFRRLCEKYKFLHGYCSLTAGPIESVLKNVMEATIEDLQEQWKGTFLTNYFAGREAIDWGWAQGSPVHIVFASSINGLLNYGLGEFPYDIARAAVHKMVTDMAAYYSDAVYVTAMAFGTIDVPLWEKTGQGEDLKRIAAAIPDKKVTTLQEAANTLAFLLSDYARMFNGQVLTGSRGWGLVPKDWKINKTR